MTFIIGLVILLVSIVAGYVSANGDLILLWQPSEFVIILGAGVAGVFVSNPLRYIVISLKSLKFLVRGSPYTKTDILKFLKFFFDVLNLIKKDGLLSVEKHIEDPESSVLFQELSFIKDEKAKNFIIDNFRLMIMGVENKYNFEEILDYELERFKEEVGIPNKVFSSLSDALPALGIIAAVLGVIITMKSVAEPPEVLGGLIAAALVGTFAGIFFSYGLFGPISEFLAKYSKYEIMIINTTKIGILTYFDGYPPIIVVEIIRKSIAYKFRPSFSELEEYLTNPQ